MPRKYTSRNQDHPHYQLKAFVQTVKNELRKLSAVEFKDRFDSDFAVVMYQIQTDSTIPAPDTVPCTRSTQMDFMLKLAESRFKSAWKENAGWSFEECYDVQKYSEHIKAAMKAQQPELIPT